MIYSEDDLLSISALQHLMFCERRCALVHIENVWEENFFTAEGHNLHDKVHDATGESRNDLRIARSLRLVSYKLGLSGVADVVEFHKSKTGIKLDGVKGYWRAFPVEYKRGKLKHDKSFEVQLCAQAICLEEMLKCSINAGAIFYGKSRRRKDIQFTSILRAATEEASQKLHQLFDSQMTPRAKFEKKCQSCSLLGFCMPSITGTKKNIHYYLSKAGIDE
ncbi:MAG: CRISPR-associated protein Cas4 [Sedimentisphaerales bacterium]|nr:CRISPR-associated protein Cas4 [Sedimentisphaerales bacterium]